MATTRKDDAIEPEEGVLPAAVFRNSLSPFDRGLFAGLLADKPNLRETELTPEKWGAALRAYATSTRI